MADGTATAGSDYVAGADSLTFAPGDTQETITVVVNGDTIDEPDETYYVNLSGEMNATISDAQGEGTITDDDGDLIFSDGFELGDTSAWFSTVPPTETRRPSIWAEEY